MLHEKWNEIVKSSPDRTAVWRPDAAPLTFAELDQQSRESLPSQRDGFWIASQDGPDFLATIIAAWRTKEPVLLLESQEQVPSSLPIDVPPGTLLIKHGCGASGLERFLYFGASQILAEGQRNVVGMGLHRDRPGLAAISLAHSYGFGCLVLPLLLFGIPIRLATAPIPSLVEEALDAGSAFFLPGVPIMWKTWWKTGLTAHPALSLAVTAGSPLSSSLEQSIFADHGLKLHNLYGTSETGAIAFDPSPQPRLTESEIGPLLAGVTLSQEGDKMRVLSDATAIGSNQLLNPLEFSEKDYLLADEGRVMDSCLHLDTISPFAINVAGRKVSPAKVTRHLLAQAGVLDAQVEAVASNDYERHQDISATVTLDPDVTPQSLKAQLRQSLSPWEFPRRWNFIQPAEGGAPASDPLKVT